MEAGIAWLALIGFEIIQGLRHRLTLSQFAWAVGRKSWWLKAIGIGLVALLAIHLLLPMWKKPSDPPPAPPEVVEDLEGYTS